VFIAPKRQYTHSTILIILKCASVFASSKTFGHVTQIGHVTVGTRHRRESGWNIDGGGAGPDPEGLLGSVGLVSPSPNNDFFSLETAYFGEFW